LILHLTKKLADKLKLSLVSETVTDDLLSWRANYVQEQGFSFLVFMNDASRFTVIINNVKAEELEKLPELFKRMLRESLLTLGVNPEVVDLYIGELGEITYSKNADRKRTAQLNKNVEAAWWFLREYQDDIELSAYSNEMIYNTSGVDEILVPRKKMIELLSKYGLPVRKIRAFDLNVKLDLGNRSAVRRLRVPANISFEQLHKVLQIAFEWKGYHLYSFGLFKKWSKSYYARPDVEFILEPDLYNAYEAKPIAKPIVGVKLSDYVPEYKKILYYYDFGDDWHHYIEIENIIDDCEEDLPILLSGEGDSPPEDVGGSVGFAEFLEIIANPKHEDYERMTQWARSQWWTPFDFDMIARHVKAGF